MSQITPALLQVLQLFPVRGWIYTAKIPLQLLTFVLYVLRPFVYGSNNFANANSLDIGLSNLAFRAYCSIRGFVSFGYQR